jgi:methionyl-tRNA synthetase
VRLYGILGRPFVPDASATILAALGLDETAWPDDAGTALAALGPGHAFTTPELLFRKIGDDERAAWQADFEGVSA